MEQKILKKKGTIRCQNQLLDLSIPKIMGIVNLTPDSFYDGGKLLTPQLIRQHIDQLVAEGADFLDVGAYSSRPGAENISIETEWSRLQPALEIIKKHYPETKISVDTFRAEIAQRAIQDYDVCMINDISGGQLDNKMFQLVAKHQVAYVLMHMKGTPQNMQKQTNYDDIIADIALFFSQQLEQLKLLGVADVVLDPGFGFSKTLQQNYELLDRLSEFKVFELPVLVGVSRKSMLYKLFDSGPENMLNATTIANTVALINGASILRVHDVGAAKEAVVMIQKLTENRQ